MSYADVLLAAVLLMLLGFTLVSILVVRKTRDPATLVLLTFTGYWTLFGAVPVLLAKREAGGFVSSYMEDKLFPILPDGAYAVTLGAYGLFLFLAVGVFWMFSAPAAEDPHADSSWVRIAGHFGHLRLLAIVGLVTLAKVVLILLILRSSSADSLYAATRTVQGASASYLRVYQYCNILALYPLAVGATLWLSFTHSRHARRGAIRTLIWLGYAVLGLAAIGENALLGNRAMPLLFLTAVAVGWVRWRYLRATRAERRPLAMRFGLVALAGVIVIGTIGISRGGNLSSPAAVLQSMASNVATLGNVFVQMMASNEKLAAHMSLYGVIRQDPLPRDPLGGASYAVYSGLVNAPEDQVFTLHYVAGWWLQVGAMGVLFAGLTFGLALIALQRLSASARGAIRGAFALPAAILPAAGVPITVLRSGPESLRAVAVELVFIPGMVCLACLWQPDGTFASGLIDPIHAPRRLSAQGELRMNLPLTGDIKRAMTTLRKGWVWVAVATVIGAVIGLAVASRGNAATYETTVSTPSVASLDLLNRVRDVKPPVDNYAALLQSDETKQRLGAATTGTSVVVTVSTDKSSVGIRVTGATDEQARVDAEAYAEELSRLYRDAYQDSIKRALSGVESALKTAQDELAALPASDATATTRAATVARVSELTMDRVVLSQMPSDPSTTQASRRLSAGNSVPATILMMALSLGIVTAAILALQGLRDRRLRFPDDIAVVTGADSVLAIVDDPLPQWNVTALLRRITAEGPVLVFPASTDDAAAEALRTTAPDSDLVHLVGADAGGDIPVDRPAIIVARMGHDRADELAEARAAVAAVGGTFVGVVAMTDNALRPEQ